MNHEYQRKFFFDSGRSKAKPLWSTELEQGYLPATGDWEIRLRRLGSDFRYTMKSESVMDRVEWEVPLAKADWAALWPTTEGRRLVKCRDQYQWKGRGLEVDHYGGALMGLTVVEVEFSSRDEAREFSPPGAFGPELTFDPRFKSRRLASGEKVPLGPPEPHSSDWSYGVLPFRKGPRGWELVLVSTRRRDRWVFPKGQPEPRMPFEKVALAEAREEAGLTGVRSGHPLVLPYPRDTGVTNLLLFPLRVTNMASRWKESDERTRNLVPLPDAGAFGEVASLGAQWVETLMGS